jgi:hypothetical protein
MKPLLWRGVAAAALAALAGSVAFTIFGLGASGAVPQTGPVAVRTGPQSPPGRFVRGDGLYNGRSKREQLSASVSGALMGALSPVAVSSPDASDVVYNTWHELRPVDTERSFSKQGIADGEALAVPSLRVHDATGKDFLLEEGAYSAAWRSDGAIAFVKGTDASFRAGHTYTGQVVVRRGVHGRAVAWTTDPARYVVYAWAGNRLLFYRVGLGERLELLVADGPRDVRPLADGSAVALSPDGRRVTVLSEDARSVRVLDVATGREQAWMDVTTTTPSLAWVGYSGAWLGDHVVAPANPGLAVFRVGSSSIELEQVLSLDQAEFPVGVQQPRFTDDAANQIVATADVPPKAGNAGVSLFLSCDRIARSCERSESAPVREWLRPVENPSRPEGGR